ncbi:MAG: ATP-binding protein [Ardenticatenales bacterium]|nr:ATP-binding protein [Ardenticatenales bacterium]
MTRVRPQAPPHAGWPELNQRYLTAELARVRRLLETRVGHAAAPSAEQAGGSERTAWPQELPPPAIESLCSAFALSQFERDVLLLCAGVVFDANYGTLLAAAQGEHRAYPTFGIALAIFPEAHWSALVPVAPLRRCRLISVGTDGPLTRSPLQIEERVLHYLAGLSHLDDDLAGMTEPVTVTDDLVPSHRALANQIVAAWSHDARMPRLPVVQLCGTDAVAGRAVAAAACEAVGIQLAAIRADLLPVQSDALNKFIQLWERESVLSRCALLVECDEQGDEERSRARAVERILERMRGAIFVSRRERGRPLRRLTLTLDIDPPTVEEQVALWQRALGPTESTLTGQVTEIVAQFSLGAHAIHTAAAAVLGQVEDSRKAGETERLVSTLWEACRQQNRPQLEELAQRIDPIASWEDLVLPSTQIHLLREAAAQVRQRMKVYHDWGFAKKGNRGLGISALFAGPSGTGKTMAAEVLARSLQLDLYRVDLSAVVSKYIGETEKNLRRIFDSADEGGAILLFDEADALFGKRSEVKDAHDRYANVEVSYLLQRMEAYRGLAILTTNLEHALDTAFLRRIRFVVQFPFPSAPQRAEIWRRIFPDKTPTEALDVEKLARLNVTGGHIRTIALTAAFLAADAGEPVGMTHLLQAARSEYAKLKKPLTETEVADWI